MNNSKNESTNHLWVMIGLLLIVISCLLVDRHTEIKIKTVYKNCDHKVIYYQEQKEILTSELSKNAETNKSKESDLLRSKQIKIIDSEESDDNGPLMFISPSGMPSPTGM